jgi:type II secretory pathway pseudopilin PulG
MAGRFWNREGTTLVELMLTLMIFAVVLGVVFSFLVGTRNSYTDTRERVYYQQSLRAVISLLTREIRSTGCDPTRAGFDKISMADDLQIGCRMDLNGDGDTLDNQPDESVIYVFNAATGELSRDDGTGAIVILRDLTAMSFTYFDEAGVILAGTPLNAADRDQVRYVEIDMAGESERGEPVHYTTRVLVRNG